MTTANQPSDATHVVTCFLLRQTAGRDEILLVQRSERVRTYRGAWAGISGYLEPGVTPLEQANTEIREETGLGADDVRLLRTGAPLPVNDEQGGLSWVVHPFLFAVAAPERLRLDWEATGHRWVTPAEMRAYPTVPRLLDAFDEVYPPDREQPHA